MQASGRFNPNRHAVALESYSSRSLFLQDSSFSVCLPGANSSFKCRGDTCDSEGIQTSKNCLTCFNMSQIGVSSSSRSHSSMRRLLAFFLILQIDRFSRA